MSVLRVKPWGVDQGEYVLIDAADFDPQRHQLYAPEATPAQGDTDAADSRGRDRTRTRRQLREPV